MHTRGFSVIEQREDGALFSLTYGKSNPPIDGNSLVISTLDRVSEHPFVRLEIVSRRGVHSISALDRVSEHPFVRQGVCTPRLGGA